MPQLLTTHHDSESDSDSDSDNNSDNDPDNNDSDRAPWSPLRLAYAHIFVHINNVIKTINFHSGIIVSITIHIYNVINVRIYNVIKRIIVSITAV